MSWWWNDPRRICRRECANFVPPDEVAAVQISDRVAAGATVLRGTRYAVEDGFSGWMVWAGSLDVTTQGLAAPVSVRELVRRYPRLLPYLALPPGWSFATGARLDEVRNAARPARCWSPAEWPPPDPTEHSPEEMEMLLATPAGTRVAAIAALTGRVVVRLAIGVVGWLAVAIAKILNEIPYGHSPIHNAILMLIVVLAPLWALSAAVATVRGRLISGGLLWLVCRGVVLLNEFPYQPIPELVTVLHIATVAIPIWVGWPLLTGFVDRRRGRSSEPHASAK